MPACPAAQPPPPRSYASLGPLAGAALLLALLLMGVLRQQAAQQMQALHTQAADQLAQALVLARPEAADLPQFLANWPGPAALVEVQMLDAGGLLLAQRRRPTPAHWAPAAWGRLMQLPDAPAQVMLQINGQAWQLRAAASPAAVLDLQWAALASALAALLLLCGVAQGLAWQALRRPATAMARFGQALKAATGVTTNLPGAMPLAWDAGRPAGADDQTPETRRPQPLLLSMHDAVAGQHGLMEDQGAQLERLRSLAHSDTLTRLPNRRHFLATLDGVLGGESAPAQSGLVLLRVRDLQGMNQRLGHTATDQLLQALGQTLLAYPQRIERCQVGRLNGADFALWLPAAGLAA